ncbi:hypothetical protein [Vibrio cyclitrophicus]|uniref:Uncharacterized protein n=2 Tax=Vibrio cyclitrophicus TaxID=47951 RepID=A0A7Z1S331_9VIBR|nr:hypothetical protein [Vibrio cyclitrophicus]PMP21119.1 hypothetical protein BCS91_20520 [Vibrio cyclitrophicus]PMP30535.1 hypothetical protein BCS90_14635 [Vibrio cyclitrophicus]
MTKYNQITSADGWYFVHENVVDKDDKPYVVYRVAVWALDEENDVIGLIHASGLPLDNTQTPKLISPPPVQGSYLHESELSIVQFNCLKKQ